MRHHPVHRKYHHDQLTFSLMYAWSEHFLLPFSHDEVVHGKRSLLDQMTGDLWQKYANLRLLYTYMWLHPGKKLLFMGSEFGQWLEWNCEIPLAWDLLQEPAHAGIQNLVTDLNRLLHQEPALYALDHSPDGFRWIDCHNRDESILSWLRRGVHKEDLLLAVANFTPQPHTGRLIGVSVPGVWREVLNSDHQRYGGSGMTNGNPIHSVDRPANGCDHSIEITISPLAGMVFRPDWTATKNAEAR